MPQTLYDRLAALYPDSSKQTLKRMVEAGRVSVNGKPARKLSLPLSDADTVSVGNRPKREPADPAATVEVIYEDEDLLVVNKPPGLLTSTVPGEKRPTLLAMVRDYMAMNDPRAARA